MTMELILNEKKVFSIFFKLVLKLLGRTVYNTILYNQVHEQILLKERNGVLLR